MASPPKTDEDDWFVCCSDDEKYTSSGCPKGKLEWAPSHEEIRKLYIALDEGGPDGLSLDWRCLHGKRPRTPPLGSDEEEFDEEEELKSQSVSRLDQNTSNFDFDADDDMASSTPKRSVPGGRLGGIGTRELKGSARKKTTHLSTILSKMERNRINDAREVAAAARKVQTTPATSSEKSS